MAVEKITVQIPKHYLVNLATHGNMGTGELPKLMQIWASRQCREHGLHDDVVKALDEKIAQSRKNLTNMLGEEIMIELDKHIDVGLKKVEKLWKRGKEVPDENGT